MRIPQKLETRTEIPITWDSRARKTSEKLEKLEKRPHLLIRSTILHPKDRYVLAESSWFVNTSRAPGSGLRWIERSVAPELLTGREDSGVPFPLGSYRMDTWPVPEYLCMYVCWMRNMWKKLWEMMDFWKEERFFKCSGRKNDWQGRDEDHGKDSNSKNKRCIQEIIMSIVIKSLRIQLTILKISLINKEFPRKSTIFPSFLSIFVDWFEFSINAWPFRLAASKCCDVSQ